MVSRHQRLIGPLAKFSADEALISFNTIMSMDTFSLLDDGKLANARTDLTLYEKYKTRLLRVDQGPRARQDPLQRFLHQLFRSFRYKRMSKFPTTDPEGTSQLKAHQEWSSQNTALIADITGRCIIAVLTAVFLTVPLATLSRESRKSIQVGVISICVAAFACLVSVLLRASNLDMMVVTAAYTAILAVFVSNTAESV